MNAHGNYTLNNDTALKEQIANQSLAAMWIAYTEQKITFTEQVWLTWLNVLNSYNYFIFRCTCLHTSDNQMRTSDVQGHYAPVMSYTHDWPLITLYTYIHIHSLASRSLSLSLVDRSPIVRVVTFSLLRPHPLSADRFRPRGPASLRVGARTITWRWLPSSAPSFSPSLYHLSLSHSLSLSLSGGLYPPSFTSLKRRTLPRGCRCSCFCCCVKGFGTTGIDAHTHTHAKTCKHKRPQTRGGGGGGGGLKRQKSKGHGIATPCSISPLSRSLVPFIFLSPSRTHSHIINTFTLTCV